MTNDEYTYEIIGNEKDAYLCAQMIAEEFTLNDPLTVFERITPQCFFDECSWPLLHDVYNERLSFLARHRSSGEIVGAIVANDLYFSYTKRVHDPARPANIMAANDFFDDMDDTFVCRDFGQNLQSNMVLHITICAVRTKHSGKGVNTQMNIILFDHAQKIRGFQYALVQVTNPVTRHIYMNKMGGEEVTIVDPTTWQWRKKGNGLLCPYKNYRGGSIPNILIDLCSDQNQETTSDF